MRAPHVGDTQVVLRRLATVSLVVVAAAASGAAYAWTAYSLDPAVPLVLLAASAALALGLMRVEWGVALLLFLTPFAENSELSELSDARLRLALIVWAAVLVAVELARLARREERLAMPPVGWAAVAVLAAALVSVGVTSDAQQGAGKLLMLAGSVTIFALIAVSVRGWQRVETILAGVLVAGLLIGLHAIYQRVTGDLSRIGFVDGSGTVEYRVTSVFSHPNQLAGFLALLVPIGAVVAVHGSRRWLRAVAMLVVPLALATVVISYSRGALVGLLALPLLTIGNPRTWPLVAGAVVAIALTAPGVWRDRIADAGSLETPEIATRLDIWTAALDAFEQRPLVGWGLDNFDVAYVALERSGRGFLGSGRFDVPPTAHNLYLNVGAEQGLLGLAALVVLGIAFLRMTSLLRRDPDARVRAMGAGLLGSGLVLALHNLFDVTFVDPKTSVLAWALIGVGAALAQPHASARGAPR